MRHRRALRALTLRRSSAGATERSRLGVVCRWALVAAVVAGLCAGVVEGASRLVHGGVRPVLAYRFENGATLLPANFDAEVAFPGRAGNHYTTDGAGARISAAAPAEPLPGETVFVVGDSQALGYMVEFEQTFGARIAQALTGNPAAARLLAAPATHPDAFLPAIRHYLKRFPGRQRVAIVTLNLGNDLDEAYAEVFGGERHDPSRIEAFMLQHSFAYMDLVTVQTYAVRGEDDALGLNLILPLLSPDERVVLAREVADRTIEALAAVEAKRKLVVIVPPDYQLDVAQFAKYAVYYEDQKAFDEIKAAVPRYAKMMQVLESFMVRYLMQRDIPVVTFSSLVAGQSLQAGWIDDRSHHLLAPAHAMLADAVLDILADD